MDLRGLAACAAAALLLACSALPAAGDRPSAAAASGSVDRCARFAACFFHDAGDLEVMLHASAGLALGRDEQLALQGHVLGLAGRNVIFQSGDALPEFPDTVENGDLRALAADIPGDGALHVFLVDARRLEGTEATSGLSFPGSARIYLFPGAMDDRVAAAGLVGNDAEAARRTLGSVVLAHELGHALGLVGCGVPQVVDHDDVLSPCHSANASSVLHRHVAHVGDWPAGWDRAAPLGPFGWDAADRADLAALRDATRPPGGPAERGP